MIFLIQAFVDNEIIETVNSTLASNITGAIPGNLTISNQPEPLMTIVSRFGWGMIGLALIIWLLAWVFVSCLNYAAARQVGSLENNFKEVCPNTFIYRSFASVASFCRLC